MVWQNWLCWSPAKKEKGRSETCHESKTDLPAAATAVTKAFKLGISGAMYLGWATHAKPLTASRLGFKVINPLPPEKR